MPRQISDEEYAFLHGKRHVADFVEGIYNDPRWNKSAKRLIKQAYPNLPIPDLDLEDKLERELQADRKKKSDEEEAARRKSEDERWQGQRKKVQQDYGFTDEGMGELEKFMQEKGVGDYEVAAGYRAAKNPPVMKDGWDDSRWNHEKRDGFKEIAADPEGWGRGEIINSIRNAQMRGQNRF